MLTHDALTQHLTPRPFRFYPQAASTNDLAQAWLRDGAPSGAVVIADEQTSGRGRLGRAWQTPPGAALAVSLILHPTPLLLPQITMLGALAVAETAEAYGATEVGIKWANDVLIRGRKVAGILAEAVWEGETLLGVVLGIGVNIRVDFGESLLAQRAVSLEPAVGAALNRAAVLATLLTHADAWTAHLGTSALFEAWRARLVTLGHPVTVTVNGERISGLAINVEPGGALLLQAANGSVRRVVAGDLALG